MGAELTAAASIETGEVVWTDAERAAVPCVSDCPRRLTRTTHHGRAYTHSEHCEDEREVVLVAFERVVAVRERHARAAGLRDAAAVCCHKDHGVVREMADAWAQVTQDLSG